MVKPRVHRRRHDLGLYLNESAVDDDGYSYCEQIKQHYNYGVPPEGPIDDYVGKISTFPLIDRPEIFGLHQNADISCQTKETNEMLDVIISLQPRTGGGGGGKTSDELVAEAAADMVANLPKPLNVKEGAS